MPHFGRNHKVGSLRRLCAIKGKKPKPWSFDRMYHIYGKNPKLYVKVCNYGIQIWHACETNKMPSDQHRNDDINIEF